MHSVIRDRQRNGAGHCSDSVEHELRSRHVRSVVAGLGACALAVALSHTAVAAESVQSVADVEQTSELDKVVVRARNREELQQDVPIPVSVVSGATLEREGALTVTEFAQRAAGITVAEQNPRQSSVSIRGLGKQGQTDAMEASVGTIVDNVFLAYGALAWGDFVDLDRVEVLRGPQGTLLGKNTTLGVVNVITKAPSFKQSGNIDVSVGSRNSFVGKGSVTGSVIDDTLAYRASFFVDKRPGWIENLYPNDATWFERNRFGGRLQFLLTPTEDVSLRVIYAHSESNEVNNGSSQVGDPSTYLDGSPRTGNTFTSRLNRVTTFTGRPYTPGYQIDKLNLDYIKPLLNRLDGVSAEVNIDFGHHVFTSISAYNYLAFIARNDNDGTPFSIGYNFNSDAYYGQYTQEFRLTSATGGKLDYQIGLFGLDSRLDVNQKSQWGTEAGAWFANTAQFNRLNTPAGRQLAIDSLNTVYTSRNERPETQSVAAFGQVNWHITDRATLTLGVRETHETRDNSNSKRLVVPGVAIAADDATAQRYFGIANYATLSAAQQQLIDDALTIRNGNGNVVNGALQVGQVGNLYGVIDGVRITRNSTSWLINPSFKITDRVLLYGSASYGEKSGVTTFNASTGSPVVLDPEKALDFELGVKSSLLRNTLILNADVYQTEVEDYQLQLAKIDPTQATGFRNELGNVDKVQLRGVEVDAAYSGIPRLTLRLAAAYNKGIYKSFTNALCSADLDPVASNPGRICDLSGRQLPGAPRVIANLGGEYHFPLSEKFDLRLSANDSYRTKANLDASLSPYTLQEAYHIVDASLGLSRRDGKYEVGVTAKNLTDTQYAHNRATFSTTAPLTYRSGDARWVGLNFRTRL